MKRRSNPKQAMAVAAILVIGAVLAALILSRDLPSPTHEGEGRGTAAHAHERDPTAASGSDEGPHGGRLFKQDSYALELTIFERGVPPQFRIYAYRDDRLLDPRTSDVSLTLERLGRPPQVFSFTPQGEYLVGDAVVEEPHSFKATLTAQHEAQTYRFGFEQVEARVTIPDAQLEASGVTLRRAEPGRIRSLVPLIGEIRLNEDRTVHVVPVLGGIVQSVRVNAGDRVQAGQVLAVIASRDLAEQRAELLAVQKRLALARTVYARERALWEARIAAEQDYLAARAALQEAEVVEQSARQKLAALGSLPTGGDLARYELRAPIDGVIVRKHIARGEAVGHDATVFVLADLSTVWAEMTVYAKDLAVVQAGLAATVRAEGFTAQSQGRVAYVSELVGAQTRTATARIVLPNPEGIWRPGLPVTGELVADEVAVQVAVSTEAIQTLGDSTVVFGRYGDLFEARPVVLGRSDGRLVEVVAGLNRGERYAAENSYLIKAELGKAGASHDH
ncbi:efflux RND transporter periplasmic adaptor subunit [Candidatus Macondimonas diazotrophica]|jgi:cobalt-zinc-cadmium efflux system membrane fusion protein|uniref:Efflux RND transporter periplasmic adaptor subunit n=1 Tax=Candidatus Macondimonas diazotrophica TaxID=2305248 RepID=A0A4Z0F7V6_9GAMM|nr:efflux RND transporter periplasmic adaptor subunit [Candidatus Macondimonas diazotrophica]NCU01621.1 efflux RND transporter periplasmic adaptor subunit [Candidatus Macondimonas diazotrophica]TFZ82417.1 efflux RND transporter periplasmic adaptor subunit [Candidatus Macondimonas diazotrophica]